MSERPDSKIKTNIKNKGIPNVEVIDMTRITLEPEDIKEKKDNNSKK